MPLTEITLDNVEDAFQYHRWSPEQIASGGVVRAACVEAVRAILTNVPRSPLRTRAINAIFDARMLANAAITHDAPAPAASPDLVPISKDAASAPAFVPE